MKLLTRLLTLLPLASSYAAANYTNPLLWEDLPDLDIIRVNSTYYYSASSFHQSPGAPLLRSEDLVNWEYIGHSVPTLDFGDKYSLQGGNAYVKGIWASSIAYRESTGLFYWIGCIEFATTYVYTAPEATGPWTKSSIIDTCYYDAGLLIDDDDTMYVAFGQTQMSVAQLSEDGLSEVMQQQVFTSPSTIGTLEGSRFYHIGEYYYIWVTRPANAQYVLRSTSPWGPYDIKPVAVNPVSPIPNSGYPHQGALIDSPDGQSWYYIAFLDSYPMGRTPAIAPVTFTADGWPTLNLSNNAWPVSGPDPLPAKPLASHFGRDTFSDPALEPQWEWSHNPDTTAFKTGANGLELTTVTVTTDYYQAPNSLTRRIIGPKSQATVKLDISGMEVGDRAGLGAVRDQSALVVVERAAQGYTVSMVNGLNLSIIDWSTTSNGTVMVTQPLAETTVYIRATVDVTPGTGRLASFATSTDGTTWTAIGNQLTLTPDWHYFLGYRFGIFNYATAQTGGKVVVNWFDIEPVS